MGRDEDGGRTLSRGAESSSDLEPRTLAVTRRLIGGIFVATLVLVSVLMFVHVRSTEIELDTVLSGVSFVSPREQALTRPTEVAALSASGLTGSELPSAGTVTAMTEPPSGVQVVVEGEGARAGSISLDRIIVPAGTRVTLTRTDVPHQFRLSLRAERPAPVTVHADVLGAVQIRPANARATALNLGAPQSVTFTSTSNDLDLDITLSPGAFAPTTRQLDAEALRLYQVEEKLVSAQPEARPMSTIESGFIYFESIAGDERKLRTGELIRFDESRGTIQTLQLGAETIAFRFQGDVRGMRAGYGERPRTLMPTLLDSLRAREGAKLLWGTALYLFGTVMALRRWWGKPL